jgi:multiple sugar transport system permease protein
VTVAVQTRRRELFYTCIALGCTLLAIVPVIWMATMTVKPADEMFARPTVWLFTPTLEHFRYIVESGFAWNLVTSIVVATVSTALVIVIGTPAAYAFSRFEMRGREDMFLFILATRMAPPVALVIPFYLLYAKVGLINTYSGLIIAYLTFNLSFYVWVLRGFCRDVPIDLEESAMVEGYPRLQVLLKITVPLLRPGIISTSVLTFIFAWNEFLYAFMLGGRTVKTLPVAIPTLITAQGVKWGELSIVGTFALLPVLIVVFALQRYIVRGLTLGAVKG